MAGPESDNDWLRTKEGDEGLRGAFIIFFVIVPIICLVLKYFGWL